MKNIVMASEPEAQSHVEEVIPQHQEISPTENHTEGKSHIVLAPEALFHVGDFPITNTLLTSWIVMVLLIGISIAATSRMKLIPSGVQNIMESVVETMYNLTVDMAHQKAKMFFPFIMTFFLFILVGNWLGLLPGMGTISVKVWEHGKEVSAPLLRSINSDLNITLGLALLSAFLTHYFAVYYLGIGGYLKKWFSLNPIMLFVGLLELVSEFTKVVSLSFRLFGNIFAGEVVLTTISGLFAYIAPLPFYLLEVLVGVVQAAVFMMLTLVFMVVLSEKHETH